MTTFKVIVGESKEVFYLHKDIFCEVSPFFRAALTGGFQETEDQTLSFPEDDVDTFERFIEWVYTKSFSLASNDTNEELDVHYLTLARIFILADKLQVLSLKNKAILIMFQSAQNAKWLPGCDVLKYIYDKTQEKCGLRRLVVAFYVWKVDYKWYDQDNCVGDLLTMRDFPAELALALAQRISQSERSNPFKSDADEIVASQFYDADPEETDDHQAVAERKTE